MGKLNGKNVAILTENGFEEVELTSPMNDKMRTNPDCVDFVQHFLEEQKPVAAICHGPQLLIETGMLRGRNMTSFPSIRTDLENAGVHWADVEVITDRGLTTSRSPKDLDAFHKRVIQEIALSNYASSPVL